MKFTMNFWMDNAAFGEDDIRLATLEAARIVREVSELLAVEETMGVCVDLNGNKVGEWSVEE